MDINDPTRTDDWVWNSSKDDERLKWRGCIANMLMLSTHLESWNSETKSISTKCAEMDFALDLSSKDVEEELSKLIGSSYLTVSKHDLSPIELDGTVHRLRTVVRDATSKLDENGLLIRSGESIESNIGPALVRNQRSASIEKYTRLELLFSEKAAKRWVLGLSSDAGSHPHQEVNNGTIRTTPDMCKEHHPYFEDIITNFASPSYEHSVLTTFCLWALCVIYGGIHALGWEFTFPSPTEQQCWRVACPLLVILGGPVSELMRSSIQLNRNQTRKDPEDGGALEVVKFFAQFLSVICLPFYLGARVFLIVEALISLRRVPEGVYESISWAQFIPHI